ncbi:hypothetical protein Ahy_B02g057884 [Arachis hypogaea]|uniref:Uncharacterized protein n=1 Tax=Arachis hypogaea TaxID=3818 RepID=A0A445AD32_ARAHY|nr:hypothetical protein Ahy_B02g057884 [Arachis hypogaea]
MAAYDERKVWGWLFVSIGFLYFIVYFFIAIISKVLPPSNIAVISAMQNDCGVIELLAAYAGTRGGVDRSLWRRRRHGRPRVATAQVRKTSLAQQTRNREVGLTVRDDGCRESGAKTAAEGEGRRADQRRWRRCRWEAVAASVWPTGSAAP